MTFHEGVLLAAFLLAGCGRPPAADPSPPPPAFDAGGAIVVPGRGSCERDDECVLSGYAEGIDGCCNIESSCGMYATSKRELDERKRKNTCRPSDPPTCPPMSPCPPAEHVIERTACVRHACAGLARKTAP